MSERYVFQRDEGVEGQETLLQFLQNFDVIEEKYNVVKNANGVSSDKRLSPRERGLISEYESSFQFGLLNKTSYSSIRKNLEIVYGEPDLMQNDIEVYHRTEDAFIHRFLGIPQLDKMFDEDYFNFEWDMHVGQNFNEHRSNYYRDHFIHQIRNMHMMLVLLDKFGLYKATRDVLKNKDTGKIQQYTAAMLTAFKADRCSPFAALVDKLFGEKGTLSNAYENDKDNDNDKERYLKDYFYNYVIKASSMLCALFHDMGYPICHFLEVRHRLSDYNPTMYMITHNAVDSFDQIASLLTPSLLFTLVPLPDIKKSLDKDKDGKFDHGAYSAIAFLLQFYNNGTIFSLSPEKRCAVEMAALAIYNHTAKYYVVKPKDAAYYSLFFQQNPIAFLLRACDDMQEWDRRYFEVSDRSNLMFCDKCLSPLIRKEKDKKSNSYKCRCKDSPTITRPNIFMRRSLYLVTTSDTVSAEINQEDKTLDVEIYYDRYRLLMMSNINETYAKYRYKELTGLQNLLANQIYDAKEFNRIRLKYFMSANPILIKLKIFEEYLEKVLKDKNYLFANQNWSIANTLYCLGKNSNIVPLHTSLFFAHLQFYRDLLLLCKKCKTQLNEKEHQIKNFLSSNSSLYPSQCKEILEVLIKDCLLQYSKEGHWEDDALNPYTDKKTEDKLYSCIRKYIDPENPLNNLENNYIGFFSDAWLFKEMNAEIHEAWKASKKLP